MSCVQDIKNMQNKIKQYGPLSLYGMRSHYGHKPNCGGKLENIVYDSSLGSIEGDDGWCTLPYNGCKLTNGKQVSCTWPKGKWDQSPGLSCL